MTTNILSNGSDLANIFAAKGATTAAATGIYSNGTDINQLLLAIADGVSVGFNTGIEVNGTDLSAIFGKLSGSLPINGQSINGTTTLAGSTYACGLQFSSTNSSWSVTTAAGATTITSGSVPSGATTVQYGLTVTNGSPATVNQATSFTALMGSALAASISVARLVGQPTVAAKATLTIQYKNSAGTVISSTSCTFNVNA